MVRQSVALSLFTLGLARGAGCGGVGDPAGGANAPCTRTKDCTEGLACVEGVCTGPDAGASDASLAADASFADGSDAGS